MLQPTNTSICNMMPKMATVKFQGKNRQPCSAMYRVTHQSQRWLCPPDFSRENPHYGEAHGLDQFVRNHSWDCKNLILQTQSLVSKRNILPCALQGVLSLFSIPNTFPETSRLSTSQTGRLKRFWKWNQRLELVRVQEALPASTAERCPPCRGGRAWLAVQPLRCRPRPQAGDSFRL